MKKIFLLLLLPFALHAISLHNDQGKLVEPAKQFLSLCGVPKDISDEETLAYLQGNWIQTEKERWEMKEKCEEKRDSALPILRELGCIDPIHAKEGEYDYALVLGALEKSIQQRLNFLHEEWKRGIRFKQVILLTGQRELNPERENFPTGISTETELLVHLFKNSPLHSLVLYVVIDAPQEKQKDGTFKRPNTASTIREWMASSPKPGKCLAVSTQPFVGYQEAVLRYYLPATFTIETVGPRTESTAHDAPPHSHYSMAIYLDNFGKWLLYEKMREQK